MKALLRPRPRLLFAVFLGFNFLLSCLASQWILKVGFLLVFFAAFGCMVARGGFHKEIPGPEEDGSISFQPFPFWLWLPLILLGFFLRFYRLGEVPLWPNGDAGWIGFYALKLNEKWDWKFFQTFGQEPPLTVWAMVGLLKTGMAPLSVLRFLPALLSLATVSLGYPACRQYFPESFGRAFSCLLALAYWPLLLGRICHQGIWTPFWVLLCLYLLGKFRNSRRAWAQGAWAAALGVALGMGFWTFISWAAPALALTAFVLTGRTGDLREGWRLKVAFGAALVLALAPFAAAAVREHFGVHVWAMSAASGWFPFQHWCFTALSYVSALFWGNGPSEGIYTASQGGLLNPFLAAAFFNGLWQLGRLRRNPWAGWMLAALCVFLLPGLMSMNVQMLRVAQALPLLLGIALWGLAAFAADFSPPQQPWVWALLVAASLGTDVARFLKSPPDPLHSGPQLYQEGVGVPEWRAYRILDRMAVQEGPGWVFTEFGAAFSDDTLFVATYDWNAAEDPGLQGRPASWAAFLTDIHYQPFLARRFPAAQWFWLDQDLPGSPGLLMGIARLDGDNRPVFQRWKEANDYLLKFDYLWLDVSESETYAAAFHLLRERPPVFQTDPFLRGVYWEKFSQFDYGLGYRSHYEDMVHDLRQAIREGYPASHLYYRLSSLLIRKRRFAEARSLLRKALRMYPSDGDLNYAWGLLGQREKTEGPATP